MNENMQRALDSLDGLSVGDAFGQMMSVRAKSVRRVLDTGELPLCKWQHTDDTQMALAIVEELASTGAIAQDALACRFVQRYLADPGRGYGKGVRIQMEELAAGESWHEVSRRAFSGRGSKGNGAAMRVAPLGAFFAGDLTLVTEQAKLSAVVTHAHPEGVAGAIAIALASSSSVVCRAKAINIARLHLWETVLTHTPPGETRDGIMKAKATPIEMTPEFAARILGSGFLVTAPDTVPFALWCAARHLDDYREALIAAVEGDGDCDTNCAIVGGIVAAFTGKEGIPIQWLECREPLDLSIQ